MDCLRIASLLTPFLDAPLAAAQLEALAAYLDLLLRWNTRVNLTAVREAESVVTRHFGESLFAAAHLLDPGSGAGLRAFDVGSGAGFPGLPLKIFCPALRLTLIESQHKKAAFLKEVIRALRLEDTDVFTGRAENYPEAGTGELVTLRAVEHFERILPIAARLLRPGNLDADGDSGNARLAVLIGASQAAVARQLQPDLHWGPAVPIPQSSARIVLVGARRE
jgi:16S rRNA (guanine527-N7)-methyltransferase